MALLRSKNSSPSPHQGCIFKYLRYYWSWISELDFHQWWWRWCYGRGWGRRLYLERSSDTIREGLSGRELGGAHLCTIPLIVTILNELHVHCWRLLRSLMLTKVLKSKECLHLKGTKFIVHKNVTVHCRVQPTPIGKVESVILPKQNVFFAKWK